jgi:EF hand
MKTQSRTLIALSALTFATGNALAQTSPAQPQPAPAPQTAPAPSAQPSAPPASGSPGNAGGMGMKYTFETLDKDGDGAISKSEAAVVPTLARAFNTLDKNRDGKIDRKEFDGISISK